MVIKPYYKLFIFIFLIISNFSRADAFDYIFPFNKPTFSNYGTLGLIQNPNARFYEEGTLALAWSHNEPYLRGSLVAYPFKWLEASYQYTDINNQLYSEFSEFSGSQSLKDKSFDIKLLLFNERLYLPQIALGIRDIGGTGLFASEYLVFNKYLKRNLDISLGLGWGNLNGNRLDNPLSYIADNFDTRDSTQGLGGKLNIADFFSGDSGYFGGIEYTVPSLKGLKFKLEYDGTNYQTESNVPISQDSKINIGLVYPISNNFDVKFSFVRGSEVNFGFSYTLNLGRKNPISIKETRNTLQNTEIIKEVTRRSDENLYKASLLYLSRSNINLQKANLNNNKLEVVISQSKFRSSSMVAGRTFQILDDISPENIDEFSVSEINGGLGMYEVNMSRDNFKTLRRFPSPSLANEFILANPYIFNENNHKFSPSASYPVFFHSLGPDLRSQIGGPDGFFFGDLKITSESELLINRNLSLITVASYGIYDNMDELKLQSDSVLPHVRTEIVNYLKESREFSIRRMQLNYYLQFNKSLFFKASAGILESMFNGAGFELLYRPFYKNFGIGLEAWNVQQRAFNQLFDSLDYKTTTGHLSFYLKEPKSNVLFTIKGGKYLAKDSGFTFDASRTFRSGFRVGAFFSLTDISAEEFGEGSFDKGFYFWIPVEIFSKRYFKRNFGWGLRPITRDGAASLNHGYPLWGVTDSSSEYKLRSQIDDFYD